MNSQICPRCETVGTPKSKMKGSAALTIAWIPFVLILAFYIFLLEGGKQLFSLTGIDVWLWQITVFSLFAMGLAYTVWRANSKTQVCPTCEQPGMVPTNSPAGKDLSR